MALLSRPTSSLARLVNFTTSRLLIAHGAFTVHVVTCNQAPDSSGPTEAARLHRAGRGVSFHFHFDFGFGFCTIHSRLPSERGSPEPPTLHSACDHSVTSALVRYIYTYIDIRGDSARDQRVTAPRPRAAFQSMHGNPDGKLWLCGVWALSINCSNAQGLNVVFRKLEICAPAHSSTSWCHMVISWYQYSMLAYLIDRESSPVHGENLKT